MNKLPGFFCHIISVHCRRDHIAFQSADSLENFFSYLRFNISINVFPAKKRIFIIDEKSAILKCRWAFFNNAIPPNQFILPIRNMTCPEFEWISSKQSFAQFINSIHCATLVAACND